MTELTSKAALLELIERERGLWDDLVAEIGEDRMLQPGATGEWNFKDVVAHLNGWRIGRLARLDAARDHSDPAALAAYRARIYASWGLLPPTETDETGTGSDARRTACLTTRLTRTRQQPALPKGTQP